MTDRHSLRTLLASGGIILLLLLREFRDRAYMVLVVSIGTGLIARDFRPGSAWGAGMVVFGGLSLLLRARVTEE